MTELRRYKYLGDRWTDPKIKGKLCSAVLRPGTDKCIVGRGSMSVLFDGEDVPRVVITRLLRKLKVKE